MSTDYNYYIITSQNGFNQLRAKWYGDPGTCIWHVADLINKLLAYILREADSSQVLCVPFADLICFRPSAGAIKSHVIRIIQIRNHLERFSMRKAIVFPVCPATVSPELYTPCTCVLSIISCIIDNPFLYNAVI